MLAMGGEGRSGRDFLVAAVFFGLVTGIAEALVDAWRMLVLHQLVWVSEDFVWMSPLAYLIFFLAAALPILFASALARRTMSLAWGIGIFGSLAVLSLLLPYEQLAWWA